MNPMIDLDASQRNAIEAISNVFVNLYRKKVSRNEEPEIPTGEHLIKSVKGFAKRNLRLNENQLQYLIRCAECEITHSVPRGKSIMSFKEFVELEKEVVG